MKSLVEFIRSSVGPRFSLIEDENEGHLHIKTSFDVHTSNKNYVHLMLSREEAYELEMQLRQWRESRGQ